MYTDDLVNTCSHVLDDGCVANLYYYEGQDDDEVAVVAEMAGYTFGFVEGDLSRATVVLHDIPSENADEYLHALNHANNDLAHVVAGYFVVREISLRLHMMREERQRLERQQESKPMQHKSDPGFVYVLKAMDGEYHKIGRTKDPKSRYKTFGILLPFSVEYVAVIRSDNHKELESCLHTRFADKRADGEWFNLDATDVQWIRETYSASIVDAAEATI